MNTNSSSNPLIVKPPTALVMALALFLAGGLTFRFFPGFVSFDSLQQFRQTLGVIELRDAHPVILVYLWRGLLNVYDHAGVLLAFHQIFYWTGVGLFSCLVTQRLWLRILLLLAIGFFPPTLILSLHLWKDVDMLVALLIATAMLVGYVKHPHRGWLIAGVLAMFFAVTVRINGFIPALPLLILMLYWNVRELTRSRCKVATLTLGATLAFILATNLAMSAVSVNAKKVNGLATLLVWDMVSISLRQQQDLLPEYLARKKSGDLLRLLAEANSSEANYPSYTVISPFPPQRMEKQLIKDWLSLVARYPEAYLRHRAHVLAVMIGIGSQPIYYPFHPGIDDNELGLKFENLSNSDINAYLRLFEELSESFLYRPWPYILLGIVVAIVCCFRYRRSQGHRQGNQLALTIATSGLLSACSLFFIATAADYRYITWTILAAVLSAIVLGVDMLRRREEMPRHVGTDSPPSG